jgi:predicted permease
VGPEFFRVMRVQPVQGRVFTEGEAEAGDPPVVVVSERFWREQLGSNADLGGLVLGIERERFQVAGVLPAGFHYPGETDVWAPGILNNGPSRTAHNWAVIARLRDGVELEDAQREMSAVAARIRLEHGDGVDAVDVRVRRLQDELVGSFRRPLGLLLGAAALVLLIACTNLASTLLARGGARRREFAVRTSLGAERGRLVRQLLTESLLLSVLGGGAGLLVAMISVKVLVAAGPSGLLGGRAIGLDGNVLAFTALLSFTSAIVFGLVPAQRLSHADPGATLRESPRGEAGSMTGRLWSTLVAAEVALAVILLVSAGLLMRSFRHVIEVDPGFDVRGVTTVDLSLPSTLYPDEDAIRAWHARVLPAVRAIPGIEAAAFINHLPLGGASMNGALEIDGLGDAPGPADYRVVSDGYFASLGIPLRAGRDFDALNDRPGTPPAVIVNEAFVRHLLPAGSTAGDAVGRRIRNLRNESWHYGTQEWLTIVGVVGDIRHSGPLTNPEPETYVSAAQRPLRAGVGHLTVRASAQPGLATALRAAIRAVDPNVPIEISTLETRSADTLAQRRFGMFVLAAFAGLAVVLGGIGIYGVVSYTVERRRREMGLRLALGASSGEVVGRTVSRAMLAVAAGLALGVPSGLAATRLMQGLLFGVRTFDPLTLGSVVTVLLAIALLASWVPARRIAAIDPAVTLRSD